MKINFEIVNETATRLANSQGSRTDRLEIKNLQKNKDKNALRIAIKILPDKEAQKDPKDIKLGFFQKKHWAPVRVSIQGKEQTVLVNIQSAIKRLGTLDLEEQEIRKHLKDNTLSDLLFPFCELQARASLQKFQKVLSDPSHSNKKVLISPSSTQMLDPSTLEKIKNYVEKENLIEEAQAINSSVYRRPSESGDLDRAIQVSPQGKIYVHLNRKTEGDQLLGEGTFKKVARAVDITTGKRFASAGFKDLEDSEKEISNIRIFAGVKGFIQLEEEVVYQRSDKQIQRFKDFGEQMANGMKRRALLEECTQGNLDTAMCNTTKLDKRTNQKPIFEGLVKNMSYMHKNGYLHRDFKPANILLEKDENGKLYPIIADLGSVCKKDNRIALCQHCTTECFASPEYATAITLWSFPSILSTTPKHDVWGLGCVCYMLLQIGSDFPWTQNAKNPADVLENLSKLPEDWFPEPQDINSPEHLVWRMLQVDPDKRISAQEAERLLSTLQWN